MNRRRPYDVAIVGMGCGFPGAVDLFAFWADVLANRDATSDRAKPDVLPIGDVVHSALADAGVDPGRLSSDRVEVVVGSGGGCDHDAIRDHVDQMNWTSASLLRDVGIASMAAIDLASRELIERHADLAVAVGVTVDEGVGAVALKRLRDAKRDGDRVYAIIKGIGFGDDGSGPAARCVRAIRRACRTARAKPETVGLIEARGLPAELRAVRAVFPPPDAGVRVLGAASTAGMDGLIKAALSLHHRLSPPTRSDDRPQSLAISDGFEVLTAPRPWIHGDPDAPRRAGVHASGPHGLCAHAVLEEHAASADQITPGALPNWDCEAFLLAADDRSALADRVRELREQLQRRGRDRINLKDLAHTLNTGREPKDGKVRLGLVAGSFDELMKHLETIEPCLRNDSCQRVRDARGLYFWHDPPGRQGDGTLAFLFPGEGSQYPGMLADLCPHFPELRAVLDTADRIARESGEAVPPSRHLFGAASSSPDALWATDTAVTAVLSSQWGMFQVLSRLGLRPDAVVGHSSGELPALAAAGTLETERSLESALSRLATIFRKLEAEGTIPQARLTAVGVDRAQAEAVCRAHGGSVVVAIDNCPHQVVLAGPPDATERVVAELCAAGAMREDLPFARAYHTPAFSAVLGPLEAFYASLDFHRPKTRVYSCSNAERMPDEPDAIRRLAVAQWTRTVAFRETIETMYRDGLRVFVDVGARGNLCGYVDDVLRGKPVFAVAANLARRSGTKQLNHLVASLFAQGLPLDATYLYARRRPQRLDLASEPTKAVEPLKREYNGRLNPKQPDLAAPRLSFDTEPHGFLNGNGNGHVRYPRADSTLTIDAPAAAVVAPPPMEFAGFAMSNEAGAAVADEAVLGYLSTMNAFLKTQNEVMTAYFQAANGGCQAEAEVAPAFPEPGPWAGAILAGEPGRWISTEFLLDESNDPIAADHTLGGRRVSALDPERKGLAVLPFFVMAEMVAQVGSLVAPVGLVLEGLEDVQAHKWVGYDPDAVLAMHGECEPDDPRRIRVSLRHRKRSASADGTDGRLVFEGVARFAERTLPPIAPKPLFLSDPKPSKFTAERLYDEQWLFHGPAMQPLTELGSVGEEGISGTIALRPLEHLLRPGSPSRLHTDPVALDGFTQLLGCWGLDVFEQGDVIFPLRMGGLTIHGERPEVGDSTVCRIHIREIERHRVQVDAELIRPDGRVWLRVEDWQDWRFYWPSRYRDVFRAPDSVLIGEPLPLEGLSPRVASAVWLAPPIDMARPVWRDVLERIQLGPDESAETLAQGGPDVRRTHRLWGRTAAKEAVRRIWLEQGGPPRFPADLVITHDADGQPRVADLARPDLDDPPAVSIAHAEGVAVALAAHGPDARPGVDVVAIDERSDDFAASAFTPHERTLLAQPAPSDALEWAARLAAAKQAAAKSIGIGPTAEPSRVEARRVDFEAGTVLVHVRDRVDLIVHTNRRKDHAWAWTLGAEA
ncbi:acyltransferase domain-containing protein [Paludisphaera borealis]|uniref:Phthioceranic/hydroxyphthioceranic acid synthase n=1 Tax=Paludisphaera borealis TaxID=1387353 RepID=A0A1U7CJ50_9BACT|nr:acyltransferase domain-containing protein [Paludisphaera borealis]APW58970.1 Phthioceranic/hydroxyphthioceranic acid synthase [Paludisphaera borealis]